MRVNFRLTLFSQPVLPPSPREVLASLTAKRKLKQM